MFQRILLPLDLTDKHQKAIQTAVELARSNSGQVILLHVVELIPGLSREDEKEFYHRLERAGRIHLSRLASHLNEEHIPCRTQVIVGQRAVDTARFAQEQKVDLIILTTPVFQAEHPSSSLGSMAWKISLLASCAVLLVKN